MAPNSLQSTPLLTNDEKNWGMICHLSSLLGFVLIPSANIWAPLLVWLIKKNDSPFIDHNGRESLNFHISLWIYGLVAALLCFTIVLIPVAILFIAIEYFLGIILSIVGAVKASNGETYRYPLTLRLFN